MKCRKNGKAAFIYFLTKLQQRATATTINQIKKTQKTNMNQNPQMKTRFKTNLAYEKSERTICSAN